MENHLVKIPKENWSELRDLFKVNWPDNILGYSTIDNYYRWNQKDSDIKNLVIYSLNGDWSDGTYIVIVSHWYLFNDNFYNVYMFYFYSGYLGQIPDVYLYTE